MPGKTLPAIEVDADIARAWTLPSALYTDPAIYEAEREQIFARTWQVVGRREQAAKPGDYFTTEIAGEPLLLCRDGEGKLRGFYNVCRHRAGPPAEGCGSRKVFRCAYHGWTYGLDGRLLNAPECEGVENFSFADFGLRSIRAEEWANWIFVNLDESAEPLQLWASELASQTKRFHIDKMQFCARREYLIHCNWKAYVDNYLEGYHLPSVHPGLNRELDYGSYASKQFACHSVQYSPIRGPENEARGGSRRYQATEGLAAEYFWIFPNWMLNCYPDNVSLNIILPLGEDKTLAIFEWYFPADAKDSTARADAVRFSDEIQMEDGRICEVVQRNLSSRSYERGRYSVKQEKCVHHFHRLYAQAMK